MSYLGTWQQVGCPKCGKSNFLDAGDMNDPTGYDPDTCKCWNCGYCFDMEGDPAEDEECCDDGRAMVRNMMTYQEFQKWVQDNWSKLEGLDAVDQMWAAYESAYK